MEERQARGSRLVTPLQSIKVDKPIRASDSRIVSLRNIRPIQPGKTLQEESDA